MITRFGEHPDGTVDPPQHKPIEWLRGFPSRRIMFYIQVELQGREKSRCYSSHEGGFNGERCT
eukprot:1394466-Amorphochlora_amoeboformis.AAC.2